MPLVISKFGVTSPEIMLLFFGTGPLAGGLVRVHSVHELELKLEKNYLQTQMIKNPIMRVKVYTRCIQFTAQPIQKDIQPSHKCAGAINTEPDPKIDASDAPFL